MIKEIYDAEGWLWLYDSEEERLYLEAAEIQKEQFGLKFINNGYHFTYFADALEFMYDDGLIGVSPHANTFES